MIDRGEVLEVNDKYLAIRVNKNISCGSCHKCGEGTNGSYILKTNNPGDVNVGDFVEINISEGKVIQYAFLLYGLPLLSLLAGFIVGNIIKLPLKQELTSLFTGITFMSVSILFLKYLYKKRENTLFPQNVKKIGRNSILIGKDPVCGMDVSLANSTDKLFYNGRTYVFCSSQCRDLFQKNPEVYLK